MAVKLENDFDWHSIEHLLALVWSFIVVSPHVRVQSALTRITIATDVADM